MPPDDVRGYDVRTGKLRWTFHVVPRKGEFGNDSWFNDSWTYSGNSGTWSLISGDEELGYVYMPFEEATGDYYGGTRPGNNLFAESIMCLDARTGKRVWHFQTVHHGLWDYDLPAAPVLADITVNGRAIKALARCRSRRSSTCSIAPTAGRCGRSKRGRCRRATFPASGTRRRSPSRRNRRHSISRACRRRI
jgi:glucose dehydrogenase